MTSLGQRASELTQLGSFTRPLVLGADRCSTPIRTRKPRICPGVHVRQASLRPHTFSLQSIGYCNLRCPIHWAALLLLRSGLVFLFLGWMPVTISSVAPCCWM